MSEQSLTLLSKESRSIQIANNTGGNIFETANHCLCEWNDKHPEPASEKLHQ